jgi:hypothetical protein
VGNYRDPFTALSDMKDELKKLIEDASKETPEFLQFLQQAHDAVDNSFGGICDLAIEEQKEIEELHQLHKEGAL